MPHTYTQSLLWPDRILCTSPAVRKEKNYALVAVSQGCWLCHCSTQSSDTSEVAAQLPPGTAGPGQERSGGAESGDAAHPVLNSRTGNGHDKHPDQTPQCGYRQTDRLTCSLEAATGCSKSHAAHGAHAGLGSLLQIPGFACPLPKCWSKWASVNWALKSRGSH